MSNLRHFQRTLSDNVEGAYLGGARAVMMQLSTGGGKTVIMGDNAKRHILRPWNARLPGGCSIAHRGELLGQMSIQLAREEVPHGLIASDKVIKGIVAAHVEEFGRSYYNARSPWKVASVDTITKRELGSWPATVGMVHIDEAHHVLKENKWGRAADLFEHSRFLLPTATPVRADGRGLGSDSHGIADALVEGPPMRDLIDQGYLTDYKVFCIPPSDLNLEGVKISAGGDFNPEQLRDAVHKSKRIVGDVVETYCKYARGKLGVTFAVDIEDARRITDAFNAAGIPAAMLTGDDDEGERRLTIRKFKNREILQLVNVDLFGEGFDLPAIECVSFARPTASFSLFAQMWGRALRLMISQILAAAWDSYSVPQRRQFIAESGKPFAYIFDHVGNFYLHKGPPDKPRTWTLAPRTKRRSGADDGIPMRVCLNPTCAFPYERIFPACPYCGTEAPPPAERGGPAQVDGDLTEVDPHLMQQYRGEIAKIDRAPHEVYTAPGTPRNLALSQHTARQSAQHHLREAMAWWAGSYPDDDFRILSRRFWFAFGVDAAQAQTLGRSEAESLRERIIAEVTFRGNVLPAEVVNPATEYL